MTAPTPDREWDLLLDNAERLGENNPDSWEFSAREVNLVLNRIAAVTAERDQAVRELVDQKRINRSNLRVMTDQLEKARQMLADAPHDSRCAWLLALIQDGSVASCSCWKAGL